MIHFYSFYRIGTLGKIFALSNAEVVALWFFICTPLLHNISYQHFHQPFCLAGLLSYRLFLDLIPPLCTEVHLVTDGVYILSLAEVGNPY